MPKLTAEKEEIYLQQFKKERERINRYYNRKRKEGYVFEDLEPIESKRYVTKKDIDYLKKLTWQKMLESAYYVNENEVYEPALEAKKRIAKQKRQETIKRKKEKEQIPEDKELLYDRLAEMLLTFDAHAKFGYNKKADSVQDANDSLYSYLHYAFSKNNTDCINRVAKNYTRLVEIVSRVQDYIIIQAEIVEFQQLVTGSTMSLEENLKATEDYNDNSMLSDAEIGDYNIDFDG